jgi:hypothetical protein
MSNSINRQELSDYEKAVGAWRDASVRYNKEATAYNASVEDYNDSIRNPRYNTRTESLYDIQTSVPQANEFYTPPPVPTGYRKGEAGVEGSHQVIDTSVPVRGEYDQPAYKTEWRPVDSTIHVYSGNTSTAASNLRFDESGKPYIERSWQERINVARPGTPPVQPKETKPDVPSMTLQQGKDVGKSDTPLVDAERSEAGRFSPFKSEEGLVQRAMKGFK